MRGVLRQAPLLVSLLVVSIPSRADDVVPLPGTKPLTLQGDIASQIVDGADKFLLRKIEESVAKRAVFWKRDLSSPAKYAESVRPNRERLAHILGIRDARVPFDSLTRLPVDMLIGSGHSVISDGFLASAVQWPAFGDVHGDGIQLESFDPETRARVIVIPDADQTPEQLCGLVPGIPRESQVALRLARSGCDVIVPALIDRKLEARNGRSKLTSREFLYRPSFELGRHLVGYEVQKVLAAVDYFVKDAKGADPRIGVFGYGEGARIALYAAALDPRIDAVVVSGDFDRRENLWQEPIDRNVFGLLEQFGDAEIASLIAPRALIVEAAKGPEIVVAPGNGGGPGRITTPKIESVRAEVERARGLVKGLSPSPRIELIESAGGSGPFGTEAALKAFLDALNPGATLAAAGGPPPLQKGKVDPEARQKRQMHEIDRHNQWLLTESPYVRQAYFSKLDTSSPEAFAKTIEPYRTAFRDDVIGRFDDPLLPPNARSRKVYDEPKYTGYEVVVDVFPDVIAYGILIVPKGIKEGEKRPVVVCQHGLEGRPQFVADPKVNNKSYNQYAIRLAERGFITFAPQNLYIFQDRFRTLQRKANPLKKTLFSIIVPQHQQITDWLQTLPYVDPARIAFYGLSYGGKSAMRIPPLVSELLPVDLLGRLQRVGLEERVDAEPV